MILLMLASAARLSIESFLFKRFGNDMTIFWKVWIRARTTLSTLLMRPATKRMMYEPGTFVFIRVPDHGGTLRNCIRFRFPPPPWTGDLRLSIKMVGDFTKSLATLVPGRRIDVYGPFGVLLPTASRNTGGLFSSVQASESRPS